MPDRTALARATALGLVAHAGQCAILAAAGAAEVRVLTPGVVLVPAVAATAAVLARTTAGTGSLLVAAAAAWFAAGLVHHYLVGITPQWSSTNLSAPGHVAWDVVFHAPPVLLAANAVRKVPSAGREMGRF